MSVKENEFAINKEKTVQMVFRKGGRLPAGDNLTLGDEPLKIVRKFKYLGITLLTTASSFSEHVQERSAAAVRATFCIKNLTSVSLETAIKLFNATIAPVVTYGIEIFWEQLTTSDMEKIENVKTGYLKRALGVSKCTPNRLVYLLTRETFFVEDIRIRMLLPNTGPYKEVVDGRLRKQKEVEESFFTTDAMTDRG